MCSLSITRADATLSGWRTAISSWAARESKANSAMRSAASLAMPLRQKSGCSRQPISSGLLRKLSRSSGRSASRRGVLNAGQYQRHTAACGVDEGPPTGTPPSSPASLNSGNPGRGLFTCCRLATDIAHDFGDLVHCVHTVEMLLGNRLQTHASCVQDDQRLLRGACGGKGDRFILL